MRKRRLELMRDRDEKRQIRESNGEEAEEEDEEDLEAIIQEEFAEELQVYHVNISTKKHELNIFVLFLKDDEVEDEQGEDEAKENMINDIRSAYDSQMTGFDTMKVNCKTKHLTGPKLVSVSTL
jgi:hypothetical protein